MATAGASPILRPATTGDVVAIAEVWHRGWHDGHAGHVPEGLTTGRTLDAFVVRVTARVADTTETTVADVAGEVAGFVMISDDEVEQVFVDRVHRGGGIAVPLLDEAERQVATAGHDAAWLAVVVGNARARRFYEKQGWVDEGDLPYPVTADGTTYISPCRRYTKRLV